jgi:flagellar biosynthesis protein FliP
MIDKLIKVSLLALIFFGSANTSHGQGSDVPPTKKPKDSVPSIGELMTVIDKATAEETKGKDWSTPVKLVIIFSGLAILPSLLVMMTSFTRIVIVLAFVRRALTTQTIPPTVAIMGLGLFLTLYTMAPTFSKINNASIRPYLADEISSSFRTNGQDRTTRPSDGYRYAYSDSVIHYQ